MSATSISRTLRARRLHGVSPQTDECQLSTEIDFGTPTLLSPTDRGDALEGLCFVAFASASLRRYYNPVGAGVVNKGPYFIQNDCLEGDDEPPCQLHVSEHSQNHLFCPERPELARS